MYPTLMYKLHAGPSRTKNDWRGGAEGEATIASYAQSNCQLYAHIVLYLVSLFTT